MSFLDGISQSLFGSDADDRYGFTGRLKAAGQTGGLAGIKDVQHDIKRWRGGGDDPSTYASDTFAALTRKRWANYVEKFVPIENQLIDYATNADTVTNAMSSASADVQGAFNGQQGALQRQLKGMGVTLNSDEQDAYDRSSSLSRSLADVQAQNLARDATMQRQQQILGNPAPDVVRMGTAGAGG